MLSLKGRVILGVAGLVFLQAAPSRSAEATCSGTGFHWDEWYRNPAENLDVKAIDHFLNQVIAMGKVNRHRIYVFGWSKAPTCPSSTAPGAATGSPRSASTPEPIPGRATLEHVRWPKTGVLTEMLDFLKQRPLP
jgi:hypothetical protein